MPTTINRAAYQKMLADDLEWVLQQPQTLARNHLEQVLRHGQTYETRQTTTAALHGIFRMCRNALTTTAEGDAES